MSAIGDKQAKVAAAVTAAAAAAGRRMVAGRSLRWDAARAEQAYARGHWVRETLADALRRAAQETPERIALIDGDVRVDCRTLLERSRRLAQLLLARAAPGSVVSFMLPNWHEAAVVYLGATLAGMVVNPILPSLRDRELEFILGDVDSRFIFIPASFRDYDYAALLGRVTARMASPPHVVVLRGEDKMGSEWVSGKLGSESISAQKNHSDPTFPALDPDAVRMILYTSGTTGRPKGVLHTHNSIHALIRQLGEHWLIEPGDPFLVPSPIAHIGGSIYAFECPLLLGTTAVLMDRWNAADGVRLLEAEGCTHMAGATPFLEQLLAAAAQAGTRLPRLKLFVCGGASVPPALIRRARAAFDRAVVTRVYGSTEVPVATVGSTRADDFDHAADTDGRPAFADVRLARHESARSGGSSHGSGAPRIDEGEICARGPQMLAGYLRLEDEASAFDADGYFRSGDLARRVDGDYLVVTGRAKDIIIRNGENISPKEVEDLLIGHPDVAEIAIVGLPDVRTGERACAVIVPRSRPGPDVKSLRSFLDGHGVALFKAPEQVVIWDALPRNDAGKVLKHQIRATLTASS